MTRFLQPCQTLSLAASLMIGLSLTASRPAAAHADTAPSTPSTTQPAAPLVDPDPPTLGPSDRPGLVMKSYVGVARCNPMRNQAWVDDCLNVNQDVQKLGIQIIRYRIHWWQGAGRFGTGWSEWFTPGIDDLYQKVWLGEPPRRYWGCFNDHEYEIVYTMDLPKTVNVTEVDIEEGQAGAEVSRMSDPIPPAPAPAPAADATTILQRDPAPARGTPGSDTQPAPAEPSRAEAEAEFQIAKVKLNAAREAQTAAKTRVLSSLQKDERYLAAQRDVAQAKERVDRLRRQTPVNVYLLNEASADLAIKQTALAALEKAALAADPEYQAAALRFINALEAHAAASLKATQAARRHASLILRASDVTTSR